MRRVFPLVLLLATATLAQDVYIPPVPIGIKRYGTPRIAKSPIAFPDERVPWIRIRSAHYDVLSNAPEDQTRDILSDLETLASILTRTSARFSTAAVPTTVLVFADRKESEPYFELLLQREKPPMTGLYVRHGGGGTMFIDASRRKAPIEKTAMHELVHDLLRQGQRTAPLWIEEGLAEYFASGEIHGGTIIAGRPIRAHTSLLRRPGEHIPIEEIFRVETETSVAMIAQFYAQSWAAVDWLMGLDPQRFFAFFADVEQGTSVADALHQHYGKTLRDMDKAMRGAKKTVPVELTGPVPDIPAATVVDRATLLFELGHFLSYVSGAEQDSQRHYAEALRIDPQNARTLAAVGRFEEAIAAGSSDPDVHLMYAEAILTTALGPFAGSFEPAEGDTGQYRQARALAERALAMGAHEGAARAAIGATYFVETDLRPGIEQLERAHALLPQRTDIALNLYAMLLRTQQFEKADALYTRLFANAEDKQLLFAVKNIRVTAETSRASALSKAGKLDEAAAVIRTLAAATEEPTSRRELEQHAATLESIAVVNRHITMYNAAIALANKGKNRDALKVLDELLTIAKDERVVSQAKNLREELRRR